jgi:Zinc binding domain
VRDHCNSCDSEATVMCPHDGSLCRPVPRVTVQTIVRREHKDKLAATRYYFCDAPDCDAVYVAANSDQAITKGQLRVRVGIKEKQDPIPLCYCFDIDKKAIRDDLRAKSRTDIPKIIAARVKAGECRCEFTNPSGRCCLGDVYQAVKQEQALNDHSVP